MTARSPLQQLQNYGDSMGLTIGFIWVYGNFMGFNGVQWNLMGFSVVNSMPQTIPNRSSCWYSPDRRWYKMTPKWLVKGLVFYWVYHITRFAMPTASHVSGMASSLPKLHISTIRWQHLHHITGSWFDPKLLRSNRPSSNVTSAAAIAELVWSCLTIMAIK